MEEIAKKVHELEVCPESLPSSEFVQRKAGSVKIRVKNDPPKELRQALDGKNLLVQGTKGNWWIEKKFPNDRLGQQKLHQLHVILLHMKLQDDLAKIEELHKNINEEITKTETLMKWRYKNAKKRGK